MIASAQRGEAAMTDILLILVGCRKGAGPPPAKGTPHDARTDWRVDCSHCWVVAAMGILIRAVFVGGIVLIWRSIP
jgi:hypothetical protein